MFGNQRETFLATGGGCDFKSRALENTCQSLAQAGSSSMIRIWPPGFISAFLILGQPDVEYGSAFRIVLCFDAAMVLLDDVMSDGQPETGPCVFACYERVKNSGQDFRSQFLALNPSPRKRLRFAEAATRLDGRQPPGCMTSIALRKRLSTTWRI